MVDIDGEEPEKWVANELRQVADMSEDSEVHIQRIQFAGNDSEPEEIEISFIHPQKGSATVIIEFDGWY